MLLGREGLELLLGQIHRLEDWELWSVYDEAVKHLGKKYTERTFERLAPGKAELVSEMKQGGKPQAPSKEISPKEFIEQLRAGKHASFIGFLKSATGEDWKTVAELALETSDEATLRRIGTLFGKKPWPFGAEESLKRAVAEPNSDHRFYLLRMLRSTRSQAIRGWALEQLASEKPTDDWRIAFDLLRLNAEREDLPILTQALLKLRDDPETFHLVGLDVLDLRCSASVEMLQILYENVSCDLCRNSTIWDLVKRRAMTREQWVECAEDSEEYTRKMARRRIGRVR